MGDQKTRYGWIVIVEHCPHLKPETGGDRHFFSVNLGRPWFYREKPGDTQPDGENPGLRGPSLENADEKLGELLYPWYWEKTSWKWFGKKKDSTWLQLDEGVAEIVSGTKQSLNDSDLKTLRDGIRKEIAEAGTNCSFPFSQGLEDFGAKQARSHVHSLAPLTHWPALLSESALKLSFFASIDRDKTDSITHFACFPEFDITSTSLVDVDRLIMESHSPVPTDGTGTLTGGKKEEVVASYSSEAVAFLCLAGEMQPNDAPSRESPAGSEPKPKLELSQGLASRSSVREAVWSYLLPAQILRHWIETKVADEALSMQKSGPSTPPEVHPAACQALLKLLWEALGTGHESDAKDVNVLEFLVYENAALARTLQNALQERPLDKDPPAALIKAAKILAGPRTALDGRTWTAADIGRWERKLKDFEELKKGKTSEGTGLTVEGFKKAWLSASGAVLFDDQASEFYGPWLACALSVRLEEGLGEIAWKPLKAKLLKYGEVRGDHWVRARGAGITQAQWDAVDKIVRALEPENLEAKVDDVQLQSLVNATMENIKTKLDDNRFYESLDNHGLRGIVENRAKDWHKFMQRSVQRSRRRPRDRGLRLDFSSFVGSSPEKQKRLVQEIRGYAIALCAGLHSDEGWTPNLKRAAWLTDTALRFRDKDGKWDWLKTKGEGGQTVWMHETVGATSNDGELLLSVEYEGAPLATTLFFPKDGKDQKDGEVGEDKDGFGGVEFAWLSLQPKDDKPKDDEPKGNLPLLGYGLLYKAVATPLDNAGGVVDPDHCHRSAGGVAELQLAGKLEIFKNHKEGDGALFNYRSSEPPGAPSLEKVPDENYYELSEETQAHAWQDHPARSSKEKDAAPPMKVALLAHPQELESERGKKKEKIFPAVSGSCTLHFIPPTAHFTFIERWINTDRVLIDLEKRDQASDDYFKNESITSDDLAEFVEQFREKEKKEKGSSNEEKPRYHPAVTAIGVEIWSPRSGSEFGRFDFERLQMDKLEDKLELASFKLELEVKAVSADGKLKFGEKEKNKARILLPQGEFVRIRLFSLVPKKYFEIGINGRFVNGIQFDVDTSKGDFKELEGFNAFGSAEYWFETIPEWKKTPDDEVKVQLTAPSEDAEEKIIPPNLLTARIEFPSAEEWVPWVKGVHVQRHEWHWTGYPIDFPSRDAKLDEWLPSLAEVGSFREIIDTSLASSFDDKNKWTMASPDQLFYRQELPASGRTSRYAALFVRPVVRFRKWLNPVLRGDGPAELERQIWGDGKIVPGCGQPGENARLPTPVLRHSIPLTATYANTAPLAREANGVLLIFDEAIRRTDELARIGGVGDILELDLVETWLSKYKEIGTNPIMHGKNGQWSEEKQLSLTAKPPFGLTFDDGANAKVAQTAMVVQPENGGGHWLLAKARVRRVVLPETELGLLIQPNPEGGHEYDLVNRFEGKQALIPDLAIDVKVGILHSVQFKIPDDDAGKKPDGADKKPVTVTMPPTGTIRAERYVLSWHKGRWGDDASPGWRCQVLAQARNPDRLTWRLIGKSSCHENPAELPRGFNEPTTKMVLNLDGSSPPSPEAEVRWIRLSEYTDPVWLTFIGSFGMQQPGYSTDFVFELTKNKLHLKVRDGSDVILPELRGLDDSLKDSASPLFHLVLVFRSIEDITRGPLMGDGGMLFGAYWKRDGEYTDLGVNGVCWPLADLKGCHAQIIALQRITALSKNEKKELNEITTFAGILEQAFPERKESLIRFLPEFLGPIAIEVIENRK